MVARLVSADSDSGKLPDVVLDALGDYFVAPSNIYSRSQADSRFAPLGTTGVGAPVRVFTFASGDQTQALQGFFDTVADGEAVTIVGSGSFQTATLTAKNVAVTFHPSVRLTKTNAFTDGLVFTGDDVRIQGGHITSPAEFDATNSTPTYAVVRITGARPSVDGLTLVNVPRVGLAVRDGDGKSNIRNCDVTGNYPASAWTEIETVNFGIMFDPGVNSSNSLITGNTVRGCVQGLFLANYGTGSSSATQVIGNNFEGCHNHAIYSAGGVDNVVVALNSGIDCSRPIALTGDGHTVTANTFTTTGTGGNLNAACSIHIRNGSNCTVSYNYLKGDVFTTTPAIDISHVSGGTTLARNKVVGNTIEVTGTNRAVGIRVGTNASTTMRDNLVQGNIVRSPGASNLGVISLLASGSAGIGNKVLDNVLVVTAAANGIHVNGQVGADVRGNRIVFEVSAASNVVVGGVFLDGSSSRSRVESNDVSVAVGFGGNVSLRGIWEGSGTTVNRTALNRIALDNAGGTSTSHFLQGSSGTIVDEVLPGAPSFACGPGSRWMRTDGGAGSTLYVKETAANSGVWRAV